MLREEKRVEQSNHTSTHPGSRDRGTLDIADAKLIYLAHDRDHPLPRPRRERDPARVRARGRAGRPEREQGGNCGAAALRRAPLPLPACGGEGAPGQTGGETGERGRGPGHHSQTLPQPGAEPRRRRPKAGKNDPESHDQAQGSQSDPGKLKCQGCPGG